MGRLTPPRPISSTRDLDVTAAADHRKQRQRPSQVTGHATPHKGRRPADRSRTHRDPDDKPVSRLGGGPGVPIDWSRSTLAHLRSVQQPKGALGGEVDECLDLEATHHIHCGQTEDHREATKAFVEKREPVFKGR